MCHEYFRTSHLEIEAAERMKRLVREVTPAPTPAATSAGGLVAVLRGLIEKVRPTKAAVPAE